MRSYLVTFHKVVPDGSGHDRAVVQGRMVVRARSDVSALYEAKARFCQAMRIADWRLRADTCRAVEVARLVA
ncbi:hypothetical protein MMB17_11435 [Methylobacterium organophilum]|uniref:hypothetical protein n=1 Tax=Methylobacterium organophilum TaxID=410 RepID=UPI001F134E22|nr:hypothetical protein [Methylobacterium organophilum]UMY19847.1 hypothetical protein MMB17_11435 [Methylobacterium organophilum]